jgi:hypothetical protein
LFFDVLGVQTCISACGFNHRSQRLVRVMEQSLGVSFLSGWLLPRGFRNYSRGLVPASPRAPQQKD